MFQRCLQIKDEMKKYDRKWMIAGGWAIDLHIGEETRHHEDVEMAIFRKDQFAFAKTFPAWDMKAVIDKQFVSWNGRNKLKLPVHEIHTVSSNGDGLEVLLNERHHRRWTYRRDPTISFEIDHMNLQSEQGIPYLNPEIVLLYKSTHTKEEDDQDFQYVFPYLNEHQKEWLKQALMHHRPEHHWLGQLLY